MLAGVALALVPASILIALAIRAHRRAPGLVDAWAAERDLDIDATNRPMVAFYLRTSRTLSPWATRGQRRTAAFAAVVAGAAVLVPPGDPEPLSGSARVAVLVAVPVVLAGVEALQRWLVRRPQPVVSGSLLRADDAIRRQSVHSIAGAGMGLQWLLAGIAMWTLAGSDVQLLRWTMWVPALLTWVVGLSACTYYESGVWQRRAA